MPDVVAVVDVVGGTPELVLRTVASLRRSHPELPILLAGAPSEQRTPLEVAGGSWAGTTVAAVVNQAWDERRCHVLVVVDTLEFPTRALDPALAIVEHDPRVATMSFLCDNAGFLTFPRAEDGIGYPAGDAEGVTRTLRHTGPALEPAPIAFALGPAVLIGSLARSAIGALAELDGPDAAARALVDFSLRGRRRGFFAWVDPSTFCSRLGESPDERVFAFPGEAVTTLVREYRAPPSPLSVVQAAARAKVCGLRVLIDAARLGPQEMGTQVATVALIRALARRDDVARVCVATTGDLPPYAMSLHEDAKIDVRVTPDRDFSAFGHVDVAHRPFQPDTPHDMDACGAVADRTLITVLDLIAYHAVSYQLAPEHWTTYREWLRQSMAQVDAVVAPSHDVRRQILLERLPVDPERLFVAELGTDHLSGGEPEWPPAAVGDDVGDFVIVLGADYTHKNRDLAVRAHRQLCDRGFALSLIMAGTPVHGSSRDLEDDARAGGQKVVVLPDVSSQERNWLLRHALLVLYPTAGEGFGLVPFEAARLGTPAASVAFGPLHELAGELPVFARDWSPTSLADAAAAILRDPGLARAQVDATLAAGTRFTWEATAARLAEIYRSLLASPPLPRPAPYASAGLAAAQEQLVRLREEHEELRDAHDRLQRSVPLRLAARASGLRDALRRRANLVCGGPPRRPH